MIINTVTETTPRELAQSLFESSTKDDLLELIKEIENNVCEYQFTEQIMRYCEDIIDGNEV